MRVDGIRELTSARLVVISTDATLRTAASALSSRHIGLIIVCNNRNKAIGVVSKSDIIRHLTSVGLTETPVVTLMSPDIVSCRPDDDLYATWQMMTTEGRQNVPVLSTDLVPLGVLDIRDALKTLLQEEKYQEQLLLNYVAGVGYQ
jgi:CBS domain-containing protein